MSGEIKTYTVNVNKSAKNDLTEIVKHIRIDNQMGALTILYMLDRVEAKENVLKTIADKINTLSHFPERGEYIPEFLKNNIKDYRQLIESPWRIFYRIDDDIVNVLLIIDSKRNIQDILQARLQP